MREEKGYRLECSGVVAGWGDTQVLSNVTFAVAATETLAVLGRNGVGKSTLLSTIIGRTTLRSGEIKLDGNSIQALPSYARARLGIGLVPQEREIFRSLTVEENLHIAQKPAMSGKELWTTARVFDLFPGLAERRRNRGDRLSGGEQQMLSIGRALMGNPSILLMDEPMEGLAPIIVDQLVTAVARIRSESSIAMLIVEQHVDIALEFTSRVIVLDRGAIVYANNTSDMPRRDQIDTLVGIA